MFGSKKYDEDNHDLIQTFRAPTAIEITDISNIDTSAILAEAANLPTYHQEGMEVIQDDLDLSTTQDDILPLANSRPSTARGESARYSNHV